MLNIIFSYEDRNKLATKNKPAGIIYCVDQVNRNVVGRLERRGLSSVAVDGNKVKDISSKKVLLARVAQALFEGATMTKHVEGIMARLKRS